MKLLPGFYLNSRIKYGYQQQKQQKAYKLMKTEKLTTDRRMDEDRNNKAFFCVYVFTDVYGFYIFMRKQRSASGVKSHKPAAIYLSI